MTPMAKVDKHSDTWQAVSDFVASERQDAIELLIADRESEQQRGRIAQLDALLRLATPSKDAPLVTDTYQ
ncbi:MAG: hypothetical protein CME80_08460 [Halomonas sp.]|nr:hypothetical protein [Halomonas sp.]MBF57736.1 hypothetical protein [Halomonas sp.]